MTSITLRELRDTRRIKTLLREGKTIEVRERDRVLGHISPQRTTERRVAAWPDFAAQNREIFGRRTLPGSNLVIEERGRY